MNARIVRRVLKRAFHATGLLGPSYRWLERRLARQQVPFVDDGHPMPPGDLITLVCGNPNPVWFSDRGRADADRFCKLASRHGVKIEGALDVLDFGCGCGRVARWLAEDVIARDGTFSGADINGSLVRWCAEHLPGHYFPNQLAPPLDLPSASMDLVYANSVLTHLTEPKAVAWLQEISRVLRKDGLAILTFHDETFAGQYGPAEIVARMKSEQYVIRNNALEGSNYMSAWTTGAYFRKLASAAFEVLEIVPGGLDGPNQAAAVLANRGM